MSEKEQAFLDKIDERFAKQRNLFLSVIGTLIMGCMILGGTQIAAVSQNTMRSKENKEQIDYTVPKGTFELISELQTLQNQVIISKMKNDDSEFDQLMKDFYLLRRAIIANINTTRGAIK